MVMGMYSDEERDRIMAEARANIANRNGNGASADIAPDLEPVQTAEPTEPVQPDPIVFEDPVAKWRREADAREAAREQAKADLRRQEGRHRERLQVDQRIAEATALERDVLTAVIAELVARERDVLVAAIAEERERRRAELADHKAEIARMLAVHEAKIEGRLAAIEPRLDKLAEVRAEVSRFREELLLGPRRMH
jgi:hypothetical protein